MPITGKLYPNGEFGVAVQRKYRPEPLAKRRRPTEAQRWWLAAVKQHGIMAAIEVSTSEPSQEGTTDDTIGLSKLANSHKTLRGSRGITALGRRSVRNSAFLLEREYGTKNLSFFTFTLPTLSPSAWQTVLDRWSEIVRYCLVYLQRLLKQANLPTHVLYVTELQTKRFNRTKEPAVHLHGLFIGKLRGERQWRLTTMQLRRMWQGILSAVCGISLDDFSARSLENVKGVQKSASAYLAKYLSKGADDIERVCRELSIPRVVTSWWGLSMSLRRLLKKSIRVVSPKIGNEFLAIISRLEDSRSRAQKIEVEFIDGKKYCLGHYGRLYGRDFENAEMLSRGYIQGYLPLGML